MFNPQGGMGGMGAIPSTATPAATTPAAPTSAATTEASAETAPAAATTPAAAPAAPAMQPNPFAAMMMRPPGPMGGAAPGAAPAANAASEQMNRARFASQLTQLTSMGFSNEAACLRALAQHNGRVDAAIDTLLASGEGGS